MKKLLLGVLLFASTAQAATTPRAFLEQVAITADWYTPGSNLCARIAENARTSMYPADKTSPYKFISALQYASDLPAKNSRLLMDLTDLKPVQTW